MLFPHQLRECFADIWYPRSVSTAVAIGLVATILPAGVHAEFFVPKGLGGSLGYGYGYSKIAESESEQSTITLTLNGNGYFWQPWFLTMGAGVGLGLSQADSSGGSGSIGKSISGGTDFTLFPESRFPTSFGFSQSDSRQEVKDNLLLGGQHTQSRQFYIRQAYNTLGGTNMNAWFTQNSATTSSQPGESIDRSLGFQIRKRVPYHDFGFGGGYFENEPAQTDVKSSNSNLLLSHNYSPSMEVGVSSVASYSEGGATGRGVPKFNSRYGQVSSSFSWRPEHRPYYISGGALVYTVLSTTKSRGVATNANASYEFARNLRLSGGVSVSVTDVDGKQSVSSGQSLGTGLSSEPYVILGFNYGWNFGINFNSNVERSEGSLGTTTTKTQRSASLSGSHSLGRSINLGRDSAANVSFTQSAAISKSSGSKSAPRSLSNSASLGWNHNGFGGSTTAGISLSDSRTFGKEDSAFQVFSAQLARTQDLSRLSSLSGSINFQASRADDSDSDVPSGGSASKSNTSKSASAQFGYGHSRFLGVRGLVFNSRLSLPTLLKNDDTQVTSSKQWDNSWAYRIGMLALNMDIHVTESSPGQRVYSMTFQAVRSF